MIYYDRLNTKETRGARSTYVCMYVGVFTRGHVGVCRDEVSYTPAFKTT